MKKWWAFICVVICMSQILIGCTANKNVGFKEFYSQVIGFSKNDEESKPIQQNSILMITNKNFKKFKDKYFTPRKIPMKSPNKEKAVIFIQISSATSTVNTYNIESINARGKTLTVKLKPRGVVETDGVNGFNGTWKWVMLAEIDKTNLKDGMKIVINKLRQN